jgi:hypothetical protein
MRSGGELIKMVLMDFGMKFYKITHLQDGVNSDMTLKQLREFVEHFMEERGLNG